MKKLNILVGILLCSTATFSQVGIGTLEPNSKSLLDLSSTSKGLLLPRMSAGDRSSMFLTPADAGMMVYQTTSPKGPYTWDGATWVYYAPVESGTANGYTLRWDGSKWIPVNNLFNQGSSIGIGTQNPNTQLQIHSGAVPTTRLQFTNSFTGALVNDGLLLGISLANGSAHLLQQENRYLWFGTNNQERLRIDSLGRVGINTPNPSAQLDVNGTFKLGSMGSSLSGIMRMDVDIDPPLMPSGSDWVTTFPCANTLENAVVYISPSQSMGHIMIAHSRVESPGSIEVKFMNMGEDENLEPLTLHVAVIQ